MWKERISSLGSCLLNMFCVFCGGGEGGRKSTGPQESLILVVHSMWYRMLKNKTSGDHFLLHPLLTWPQVKFENRMEIVSSMLLL